MSSPPSAASSASDFRIEKDRLPVALTLIGGERLDGDMFVSASPYSPYSPLRLERPRDILDSPEPFFPLELATGGVVLIAKERIMEVRAAGIAEDDDVRRASARSATLEITFIDGSVRAGMVLLEMPSDRPRLLDFLNQQAGRFLTLYETEGVRLVNTRLIERVRPLD